MRKTVPALAAVALLSWAPAVPAQPVLTRFPNATTSFTAPIHVASAPGDPSRVYVAERGGVVRVVRDGALQPGSFLDISADVAQFGEGGLLSIAFAPDFGPSGGKVYAFYTDDSQCTGQNCDGRLVEYSATPDAADVTTERELVEVPHRDGNNHHGGQLQFGPDGLLYLSTGDGGGTQGDPECDAQDPASLSGKILRVDPRAQTPAPEIYALGLRNPYRFSFDRLAGDLLVGDVGEASWEEVSFLAAGTPAGANFGWNEYEGNMTFPSGSCVAQPPPLNYVPPALTYPNPAAGQAAVTGGFVLRDPTIPSLYGRYLYADFYVGDIRSALVGTQGASDDRSTGLQATTLSSFGEDALCRVYVAGLVSGFVYRLEENQPSGAPGCPAAAPPPGGTPSPSPSVSGAATTTATTITGGPVAPPPDRIRPVLRASTMARTVFSVAARPTAVVTAAPRGTAFRFTLSERATVTIRIYRRHLRRPLLRLVGTLTRRSLPAGRRSVPFSGRIGRRTLAPARYQATLRARDPTGNVSRGVVLRFTVVRG